MDALLPWLLINIGLFVYVQFGFVLAKVLFVIIC